MKSNLLFCFLEWTVPSFVSFKRPTAPFYHQIVKFQQDDSMWNETIASSVIGWSSIACWIIVYTPQLIENYTLKSGEGLSVYFVLTWLTGDLANLLGAVLAGLLPTIIILATYYSLCDIGLLFQIFYYRHTNPVHLANSEPSFHPIPRNETETSETTSLLAPGRGHGTGRSWRRVRVLLPYSFGICFVLLVGGVSYVVNTRSLDSSPPTSGDNPEKVFDWKSQVFGWISAALYIGSRFPQIIKNFSTKCAGLSSLLFFFAIWGNITYSASILVVSRDPAYLKINAPWLAGSALNVILDIFVLFQFVHFRDQRTAFVSDEAASR